MDIKPIAWFDACWFRETYAVAAEESCVAHCLQHRVAVNVSPNPFSQRASTSMFIRMLHRPAWTRFKHYLSNAIATAAMT
jgi:hypothetical protein